MGDVGLPLRLRCSGLCLLHCSEGVSASALNTSEAFGAWWPRHAARHNSRSPVAAREAFVAGAAAERARWMALKTTPAFWRLLAELLEDGG